MCNIGILYRRENLTNNLQDNYIDAIEECGANAIILYESDMQKIEECDGILLPGGDYKQRVEDFMIWYTLEHNLPIFGICQGMQSMATFNSNIKIENIRNTRHNQQEGYIHNVKLFASNLKNIFQKENIKVNSHHLQTVKDSKMFRIVGVSNDGLIEAVERSEHPFQIGVQWHPEKMRDYDEDNKRLIKTFVKECKKTYYQKNTQN